MSTCKCMYARMSSDNRPTSPATLGLEHRDDAFSVSSFCRLAMVSLRTSLENVVWYSTTSLNFVGTFASSFCSQVRYNTVWYGIVEYGIDHSVKSRISSGYCYILTNTCI